MGRRGKKKPKDSKEDMNPFNRDSDHRNYGDVRWEDQNHSVRNEDVLRKHDNSSQKRHPNKSSFHGGNSGSRSRGRGGNRGSSKRLFPPNGYPNHSDYDYRNYRHGDRDRGGGAHDDYCSPSTQNHKTYYDDGNESRSLQNEANPVQIDQLNVVQKNDNVTDPSPKLNDTEINKPEEIIQKENVFPIKSQKIDIEPPKPQRVPNEKQVIAAKQMKNEPRDESSDSSSEDSSEEEVKKVRVNIKQERAEKKLPTPSSSDSSSDFSDSDKEKEEGKKSEEEVLCLGAVENFEDLVSEDNSKDCEPESSSKNCGLCDKKGHTSFNCMMICKNCGEQYHNLKACPKPPNLSIMLQHFLEFCMNQCSQYNPEQRFQFNNGLIQGQMLPGGNFMDNDGQSSYKKGKKRSLKKADTSEESVSDSSQGTSSTKRKRKRIRKNDYEKMPFSPFGSGFNNGNFNPMNMMAQMMGFNTLGFPKK